jgi:hypothetical protein
MAEMNSSRFRTPSGGPLLREAPVGTKLLLKDKTIVEILGNPGDGGWVNVKIIESPAGTHTVDDEEWIFYTDVSDFAQEMPK